MPQYYWRWSLVALSQGLGRTLGRVEQLQRVKGRLVEPRWVKALEWARGRVLEPEKERQWSDFVDLLGAQRSALWLYSEHSVPPSSSIPGQRVPWPSWLESYFSLYS